MKTPEELNALKEEELEQVVGGNKIPDPGYYPEIDSKCPEIFFDAEHWTERCTLPKESRTKTECNGCRYNMVI